MTTLALAILLAAGGSAEEAEGLASRAMETAAASPEEGLAAARRALAMTEEFEPTAYVKPGRKGEVVEDAYLAARAEYRRHRARLYEAVGECLARAGRHDAAVRYLRRAADLDAGGGGPTRLAASLVVLGRGREALDALLASGTARWRPERLSVAQKAADLAGIPSLQAELDARRLARLAVKPAPEYRDGPFRLPDRTRLSTGGPLDLGAEGVTLLYVAEESCRTCSADLEAIQRARPAPARLVLVPASPERDQGLRGVVGLYRYRWPLAVGAGIPGALGLSGPVAFLTARGGFVGVVAKPPFGATLAPVLEILQQADVKETPPRPSWNRRQPQRRPATRQGLLEDGLAPGEDLPAPAEFERAVEAYRSGKAGEALKLFGEVEAKGDGWLLPPEARLNRAICLAALGRRDEARRLLLRIGDSRFQDEVDRTLERVGGGGGN